MNFYMKPDLTGSSGLIFLGRRGFGGGTLKYVDVESFSSMFMLFKL